MTEAPLRSFKDPMFWAQTTRINSAWIRQRGHKFGIDPQQFILGSVLSSIIEDDLICFGLFFKEKNPALVEGRRLGKLHLMERMDWEITTPETPKQIRDRLIKIKKQLEPSDWSAFNQYAGAFNTWINKIRNYTQHQLVLNQDLRAAVKYETVSWKILSQPWQEYLHLNYGV